MGHDLKCEKIGQKIEWNHPLYHFKRKVWNSQVDRYPAVIFECENEEDVMEAIRYAREHQLKITVRGGGFHPAGKSVKNEAVLIDLSYMYDVHVDEVSKIATVGAGARVFEVDKITQEYGLAIPLGMNSNIGVSGLALGGGLGYLRAKYGLTSDNIVGAHLITGTGKKLYVNKMTHPELFWAIRGAGSNFGVVTSFEFKLHQVGRHVLGVDVVYDYKDIDQILEKVEEYRTSAPDDISFNIAIINTNSSQAYVRLIGMYIGELNLKVEKEIIQPLLELASPIADNTEIQTYQNMQQKLDSAVGNGFAIEGISLFFRELDPKVIQLLKTEFEKVSFPVMMHLIELHGKINRISAYESAFTIRDADYLLVVDADPTHSLEETKEWIQMMYEKLLPYSYNQISYLNSSNENEQAIQNTYRCIYERLSALKKELDPENLFCPEHRLIKE